MRFKEQRLEDLCELVIDCPHSTPKWTDKGFIVLRNQNIRNGVLDLSAPSFTDEDGYKSRIKRAKPRVNDIVFTREAPMGEVCLIPEGIDCCLGQRQVLLRANNEIDPYYLFWALQSPYVQHQISWNEGTGTTVSNVRIPVLKDLKIPRLGGHESWIAKTMTSLALKSQINEKINQTLEQMAQALFKSWFVEFEPVKAKMAALEAGGSQEEATLAAMTAISGKNADALAVFEREHPEQYAELKATAELFPLAMQDSELGEIPEGWSIKPLDGIATYQNGLALQKFRPENENDFLPVVKIAQLKKGFSDGEEKASPNIKPECIIDNGDVVFSWSGSLMVDIWCGGKAALNQHLFKVSSTKYPKWLYYKYTAHHLIEFQRIAEAKAVTMGHIKREHLSQAKCLIPSSETVHAFTPFFEPVLNKVISNRLETRKLENIRDTLLPKLLSGEITLPEAEQAESEAENV